MHADAPPDLATIYRTYTALMVRHPQDLQVEQIIDPNVVQLRIRGHRADQGLLIGSNGQNVKAMQVILAEVANRTGRKVRVRILEPWIGEAEPAPGFAADPKWSGDDDLSVGTWAADLVKDFTGCREIVEVNGDRSGDTTTIRWMPSRPTSPELEDALHTLFRAIGKTQGRLLSFHAMSTPQSPVRA